MGAGRHKYNFMKIRILCILFVVCLCSCSHNHEKEIKKFIDVFFEAYQNNKLSKVIEDYYPYSIHFILHYYCTIDSYEITEFTTVDDTNFIVKLSATTHNFINNPKGVGEVILHIVYESEKYNIIASTGLIDEKGSDEYRFYSSETKEWMKAHLIYQKSEDRVLPVTALTSEYSEFYDELKKGIESMNISDDNFQEYITDFFSDTTRFLILNTYSEMFDVQKAILMRQAKMDLKKEFDKYEEMESFYFPILYSHLDINPYTSYIRGTFTVQNKTTCDIKELHYSIGIEMKGQSGEYVPVHEGILTTLNAGEKKNTQFYFSYDEKRFHYKIFIKADREVIHKAIVRGDIFPTVDEIISTVKESLK
jgi:hypothetical protein